MNINPVETKDRIVAIKLTVDCMSLDPLGVGGEQKIFWRGETILPAHRTVVLFSETMEYKKLLVLHDEQCKAPDHNLKVQFS